MNQCDRCKGFPSHYFEEHSINPLVKPRWLCPTCVIVVAGTYLSKAQQRKVQERERRARRHTAPEATQ